MSPVTLLLALASMSPEAAASAAAANPAVQQTPTPAHAPVQESSQTVDEEDTYDLGTITATAVSRRGAALGGYEPEAVLDAEQLKAYGAGTIEELMTLLEPLTRSSRGGSPVFLVNGRRISGFQEIRGIPPEAIERTEILPEETALSYGYTADQRVVNFVLKENFRSVALQGQVKRPFDGGRTQSELETNIVRIGGTQRWTLDLEYQADSPLYETERDIVRQANGIGATPEERVAYQTLNPRRRGYEVSGSYKRDLESGIGLTVSGNVQQNNRLSYLGLPGVSVTLPASSPFASSPQDVRVERFLGTAGPLSRDADSLSANINALADGYMGEWRWTVSGGVKRSETETTTMRGLNTTAFNAGVRDGTIDPFGDLSALAFNPDDVSKSINTSANVEGVINGALWQAPAGALNATFKGGFDTQKQEAENLRGGVYSERSLSRDRFSASGNFNMPLFSSDMEGIGKLGNLSANLNLQYEDLSDFGGLNKWTVGLNYAPIDALNFTASYADEQSAPSMAQLNDPVLNTPNVPVYDFATGQSVIINRVEGGNRGLSAEDKSVLRLGVNWKPLQDKDLRFTANYTRTETDGIIASFPTITPALEAALPERFTRDLAGNLIEIDARPLNFENSLKEEIRWGLNFSTPFGKPNAAAMARQAGQGGEGRPPMGGPRGEGTPPGAAQGGRQGGGPRMSAGGGGARMGGGGGRGGQMQPGQGRFNVSLYHTYRMTDELTIREGLPVIDLLDGGATGARGGQSRNELQLQAGVFKSGMGAFLNANWAEGTRVSGGNSGDLNFSDLTTVNLNMFADLGQRTKLVEKFPWLTGSRVSIGIENLFDERIEVRDALGNTPPAYQPDYMDPMGRTFRINFRKIIF
ncbi:TonB-dependent receptor [Brevundimonas sp. GN22]